MLLVESFFIIRLADPFWLKALSLSAPIVMLTVELCLARGEIFSLFSSTVKSSRSFEGNMSSCEGILLGVYTLFLGLLRFIGSLIGVFALSSFNLLNYSDFLS